MLAAGQEQGIIRGRSPLIELTSARRALCQLVEPKKIVRTLHLKCQKCMTEPTDLSAQVDEVGVRVVHGEHDSVRRVQLHHHDRVVQVPRRAQRVLRSG